MLTELLPREKRTAIFSDDRVYRYALGIIWDESLPMCQVIGLNPSTADEYLDDPTVRRCKGFARREGCGGLVMTNIFAYRDTDPKGMMRHTHPIQEVNQHGWNDYHLANVAHGCKVHIAAWGVHGEHMNRGREVEKMLNRIVALKCLGVTNAGHPKHPLYLAASSALIPFSYQ